MIATGLNIDVNANVTTADGNLSLSANRQAIANTGDFDAVPIESAKIETTGSGNVLIQGTSGNASANHGVLLFQGGAIVRSSSSAADAGTITITGDSTAPGGFHGGVVVSDRVITSVDGDITISSPQSVRFLNNFAQVISTGSGVDAADISITGDTVALQNAGDRLPSDAGGISITTTGGDFTTSGNIAAESGDIQITSAQAISLGDAVLSTDSGNLTFDATTDLTTNSNVVFSEDFDSLDKTNPQLEDGSGGEGSESNGWAGSDAEGLGGPSQLRPIRHTGTTSVTDGSMVVNGAIPGSVSVSAGANLKGSGTVGTTSISTGGTAAPGNLVGRALAGDDQINIGGLSLLSNQGLVIEDGGGDGGGDRPRSRRQRRRWPARRCEYSFQRSCPRRHDGSTDG